LTAYFFAPEAQPKIARSFNCGIAVQKQFQAPAGRQENFSGWFSRPCGTRFHFRAQPAVETAGYFQTPLCGWTSGGNGRGGCAGNANEALNRLVVIIVLKWIGFIFQNVPIKIILFID
jgi:hypothetical protein